MLKPKIKIFFLYTKNTDTADMVERRLQIQIFVKHFFSFSLFNLLNITKQFWVMGEGR